MNQIEPVEKKIQKQKEVSRKKRKKNVLFGSVTQTMSIHSESIMELTVFQNRLVVKMGKKRN